MKEKDAFHSNVIFESNELKKRKFQPLVNTHCRQTLHRLIKNEDKMNPPIYKATMEKTVKKMDKL